MTVLAEMETFIAPDEHTSSGVSAPLTTDVVVDNISSPFRYL